MARLFAPFFTLVLPLLTPSLAASIPDYVLSYAPLVYLDVNEQYYPSDIGAQIVHTFPAINYTAISNVPSDLSLSDLTSLNALGGCTSFSTCTDLYLTSKDHIVVYPPQAWLQGVLPDPVTGETEGATSCAVIVTDHGNGTVDAFYMFFYAFNLGIPIGGPNGVVVDDHVGDWEHMMVRFSNGSPLAVYYSQHSGGIAYTYDAVLKNGSRPLGFSSKGGHATYASSGTHVMFAGAANDSTSLGPLWDPVAGSGAWYFTFTPNTTDGSDGTFIAVDVPGHTARGPGPVDWLHYYGRWGDKQYTSSYPNQTIVGTLAATFEDGPTGPLDKFLFRQNACPNNVAVCQTQTVVPSSSGVPEVQTVSRTFIPATATATSNSATTRTSSTSSTGTTLVTSAKPTTTSISAASGGQGSSSNSIGSRRWIGMLVLSAPVLIIII